MFKGGQWPPLDGNISREMKKLDQLYATWIHARYMLRKGGIKSEWWSLRPVMNKQIVATSTASLSNG